MKSSDLFHSEWAAQGGAFEWLFRPLYHDFSFLVSMSSLSAPSRDFFKRAYRVPSTKILCCCFETQKQVDCGENLRLNILCSLIEGVQSSFLKVYVSSQMLKVSFWFFSLIWHSDCYHHFCTVVVIITSEYKGGAHRRNTVELYITTPKSVKKFCEVNATRNYVEDVAAPLFHEVLLIIQYAVWNVYHARLTILRYRMTWDGVRQFGLLYSLTPNLKIDFTASLTTIFHIPHIASGSHASLCVGFTHTLPWPWDFRNLGSASLKAFSQVKEISGCTHWFPNSTSISGCCGRFRDSLKLSTSGILLPLQTIPAAQHSWKSTTRSRDKSLSNLAASLLHLSS